MRHEFLLLSYVFIAMALPVCHAAEDVYLSNGGFELPESVTGISGWEIRAKGHAVTASSENPASGRKSLRIRATETPRGTQVRQEIPLAAIRSAPLQLHGKLRTENVTGAAVLFVVVEGEQGRLFVDDMRERQVRGTTGWTHYSISIPRLEAATSAYAGILLLGAGTAWADDLRLVQQRVDDAISPGAAAYLDNAIDIMAARHVNRANIDWHALRAFAKGAAAGAQTSRDTWPAIKATVTRLGDSHSQFIVPRKDMKNGAAVSGGVADIRIHHEMLDGRIAYIGVPSIHAASDSDTATTYVDRMHAALRTLEQDGACGWIVDLRKNTGGTMWPMLAGIGPLLGEGVIGAHVVPDRERSEWWYRDGRSGVRTSRDKTTRSTASEAPGVLLSVEQRVAVLLSENTASAGEAVAIAFEGLENARSFGSPTSGLTTANVGIPLGDGAKIILAIARSADRNGTIYFGPIDPDVRLEALAPETVLESARRWLVQQPECHSP
ncbi:MAG TPA: S41 family peptidase [Gammaproteobacteria bacterium]